MIYHSSKTLSSDSTQKYAGISSIASNDNGNTYAYLHTVPNTDYDVTISPSEYTTNVFAVTKHSVSDVSGNDNIITNVYKTRITNTNAYESVTVEYNVTNVPYTNGENTAFVSTTDVDVFRINISKDKVANVSDTNWATSNFSTDILETGSKGLIDIFKFFVGGTWAQVEMSSGTNTISNTSTNGGIIDITHSNMCVL